MRIYISADMEGVSGVVSWDQTGSEGRGEYERARHLMTQEVNAAIEGAFRGGATYVLVNDSHNNMRNILIEQLDPRADLITGSPKPYGMMQGLDSTFHGCMFVGYHAMAGAPGVLSHTYAGSVLQYIINDQVMGETGMNAYFAGEMGVPVLFVSGDAAVAREAEALIPHVRTAQVKEAIGRSAARCMPPQRARALIQEAAAEAVSLIGTVKPLIASRPVELALRFTTAGQARAANLMPGTVPLDELTLSFTAQTYTDAFRAARAMISLAART
ncbi:MAG: M55 family metallopeptidase [Bacillota bacterium]